MVIDDNLKIEKITLNDLNILSDFIKNSGTSLETFRYFDKRDLKTISNHIITILLFFNNKPIGYGHLETEDNRTWLGIMVSESEKGKGYGKVIMSYLISYCKKSNFSTIFLSVDKSNISAIQLYQKFGFEIFSDFSSKSLIMQNIF